jgi:hypothetical protein
MVLNQLCLYLNDEQTVGKKSTVMWDVTPYSPAEVHRSFGGKVTKVSNQQEERLLLGLLVDHRDGDSSSEMSANFYQTTRRHIPEDGTLHSHR